MAGIRGPHATGANATVGNAAASNAATAQQITRDLLIEIPKRFAARAWRINCGRAVPMSVIRQAVGLIRAGRNREAIELLEARPVQFGIPGMADISGIGPGGRRLEIEVKAARDKLSEEQISFGHMIEKHGGIFLVVRNAETALVELAQKCR